MSEKRDSDRCVKSSDDNMSQLVANHYNNLEEKGINARKESSIYHMRNFNNWIKSIIIAQTLNKIRDKFGNNNSIFVLDIGCGKGGDLLKYKKANIKHIVCADIADTSVKQCEQRYNEMKSNKRRFGNDLDIFSAQFITADCTRDELIRKYNANNIKFDMTSIQFSFHYCFESIEQAKCMIKNASESLKVGGYLIGSMPDSLEIVKRLRESNANSFGNSVYSIHFDEKYADHNYQIPLFGAKYHFHLEGVVNCPEFLVYFPVFEDLCRLYGLKLVFKKSFAEYYSENKDIKENEQLLNIMDALECYSSLNRSQKGEEYQYEHVNQFLRQNNTGNIGTLTKSEWESISLYLVFMFEKVDQINDSVEPSSKKRLKTNN